MNTRTAQFAALCPLFTAHVTPTPNGWRAAIAEVPADDGEYTEAPRLHEAVLRAAAKARADLHTRLLAQQLLPCALDRAHRDVALRLDKNLPWAGTITAEEAGLTYVLEFRVTALYLVT